MQILSHVASPCGQTGETSSRDADMSSIIRFRWLEKTGKASAVVGSAVVESTVVGGTTAETKPNHMYYLLLYKLGFMNN